MKKLSLILALAIAITAPTIAAGKGGRAGKGGGKQGAHACMKSVKGFDTDKNGQIDGKEVDALKSALAGNPDLKVLDKNANGQIDDDEITALNARMGKHGKGKGAGKGKRAGKKKEPAA
jgi:hypothetical protein